MKISPSVLTPHRYRTLNRSIVVLFFLLSTSLAQAQARLPGGGAIPPGKLAGIPRSIRDGQNKIPSDNAPPKDPNDTGKDGKADSAEPSAEINVKNADIAAVIRIFSKKTRRNFILDERVKGKVSIYLPGKVSSEESLKILDSVLGLKGFTAVPLGENLWKVIPSKEAKQSTIPTLKDDSRTGSASVVTRILNLKYVGADEAKEVISQLVSPDGLVSAYGGTNALLVIDYEDNVQRLVDIINTVDVPFSNREMTIIPVKYAEAKDIADKISEILGLGGKNDKKESSPSPNNGADIIRARMRESNSGLSQVSGLNNGQVVQNAEPLGSGGSQPGAARAHEPKIIPDERTNAIIVVADDDTTARIRAVVSQLDSELDMSGFRYYVYRCQHANAEEIAGVLSGLVGGNSASSGSSGSGTGGNLLGDGSDGGLNTNSRNRGGKSSQTQSRNNSQKRTPGRSRSEGSDKKGATSVQLGEEISITADKATNSLVINASKTDYEKIRSLLLQLDIKRRQVLVEAMLLEVGIDDSTKMGTDWLTSTGGKDGGVLAKSDFGSSSDSLATLFSNPSQISEFSVAAASSGSLKLPGGITVPSQAVLLTAAESNSNVNVLSSPNILTTDNEAAEIVVGQNVPFLASQSTSDTNLNNTFNQIDRQDVGITLRLTPQISSQSFVTMNIFTEVSSVVEQTQLGPTTAIRTSETTVIAKDGQMVVIGGLLADTSNNSDAGIPFMKDIPVLGSLFKSGNDKHTKSNLLIFITPRIVKDQFDQRDITTEHRDEIESEITHRGVYPNRSEVLRNDNINKVTEATDLYEGQKPTTILPREEAVTKPLTEAPQAVEQGISNEKSAKEAPIVSHQLSTDSPGVIQLKIAPKLNSAPKALQSALAVEKDQKRFLLMKIEQAQNSETDTASLPFKPETKTGIFGIEVPEGSSVQTLRYFKPGASYRYRKDSGEVLIRVQDAYKNRQLAQSKLGAGSVQWYTLSPFEVMSLGRSQWLEK